MDEHIKNLAITKIEELSDSELKLETRRVTDDVSDLLVRREDCMDALYARGLVTGGGGLQAVADRVANILGLPAPKIDITRRARDAEATWTNPTNIASIVEAFIKQGIPDE
jgi:hypothetical protein